MQKSDDLMGKLDLINTHLQELKSKIGMPPKEILTYAEGMEILDCSRNTMDRLRKEGVLKVYTLRGKLYLKYSELMAMIDESNTDAA